MDCGSWDELKSAWSSTSPRGKLLFDVPVYETAMAMCGRAEDAGCAGESVRSARIMALQVCVCGQRLIIGFETGHPTSTWGNQSCLQTTHTRGTVILYDGESSIGRLLQVADPADFQIVSHTVYYCSRNLLEAAEWDRDWHVRETRRPIPGEPLPPWSLPCLH
jgi:hypothetical protein